eukprot:4910039-Prymnesium_polylepis.1
MAAVTRGIGLGPPQRTGGVQPVELIVGVDGGQVDGESRLHEADRAPASRGDRACVLCMP